MAGGGRTAGKYGYSDNSYYSSMYIYVCTHTVNSFWSAHKGLTTSLAQAYPQQHSGQKAVGFPVKFKLLQLPYILFISKDVRFNFNISHVFILQFIYTVESVFICCRLSDLPFPNVFPSALTRHQIWRLCVLPPIRVILFAVFVGKWLSSVLGSVFLLLLCIPSSFYFWPPPRRGFIRFLFRRVSRSCKFLVWVWVCVYKLDFSCMFE